jgi:hypothetical protein
MRHLLHTTLLLLLATTCPAQDIAPLVNAKGELILFDAGRFERLAPTAPRQMHVLGGRLLFEDQQGRLLLYTERGTAVKRIAEPGTFREVSCQGGRAAFRQGDALMAVLHDRVVQLCPRAGRFTVSDSLIVFHDLDAGLLQVHWKGAFHTLAAVGGDGGRPQWESGPNTVAFFDKAARRLHLFHRGHTRVLVEGTDVGRAAAGLDLVAFQGVDDGGFSILHNGRVMPVSFSPAFRFAAGRGMVGFVDHGGRLRARHHARQRHARATARGHAAGAQRHHPALPHRRERGGPGHAVGYAQHQGDGLGDRRPRAGR